MIHAQKELTKAEFVQQQCPKPSLFDKELTQPEIEALTGVVSYIKLGNDNYHVLSRFEDDEWVFPASKSTSGTPNNRNKINFKTIENATHRLMAKWIIWQRYSNGLALGSLLTYCDHLKLFLNWVQASELRVKQGLTAFLAREYVEHVNALTVKRKGKVKPLTKNTKVHKFLAVEAIYQQCRMFDWVKEHPWVASSATEQAGHVGQAKKDAKSSAKTPIIPDDVLMPLCSFTKGVLDRAQALLDLRDKLDAFEPTAKTANGQSIQKCQYMKSIQSEFDKLDEYNNALVSLRDSCIFWILLTTGMRIHEVLGIERGGYRTETKEDETYYYVKSVSEKTDEGKTEWIAPKIAIDAIKVLERYSQPLQDKLERDVDVALDEGNHEEVLRLQQCSNKICISSSNKQSHRISILSGKTITDCRLPNLCEQIGSDWKLAAHQFRRTFANYVVHSELGDLRALKEHFKHWSITMTALYAYNDDLDQELFEEMLREKYWVEEEIKCGWFELDMPITGGAIAEKVMRVRADEEQIKTFGSRREMAKAYSGSIPIRSTGIGWCTNDDDGCMGGKCDECDHGIVDKRNIKHWEGMLIQQLELSELDDIGESGKEAAAKGMERCENVLTSLGMDVNKLKAEISAHNHAA